MNQAGDDPTNHQTLASRVLANLKKPKSLVELEGSTGIAGAALFDCLEHLIDEGLVTVDRTSGSWAIFRTTISGGEAARKTIIEARVPLLPSLKKPYSPPHSESNLNPPRFVRAYRGRLLVPMERTDGSGWICRINLCTGDLREVIDTVDGSSRLESIERAMVKVDQQISTMPAEAYA